MGRHTLNEEQLEFFKDERSIDTSNGVRVCHKCGIEKPIKSFKIRFNNNSGSQRGNICNGCVNLNNKRVDYLKTIHPLPEEHYLCPICHKSKHDLLAERKPEKKYTATFVLDHDHNTGEFRGYICWKCNSALGFFEEKISNIRRALHFLEQYEKGESNSL